MADKQINELPGASEIYDETLIPAQQNGQAVSVAGSVFKSYAVEAAKGQAEAAQQAASFAQEAAGSIGSAVKDAQDAAANAEASRDAIANMTVEAHTLPSGSPATVGKELVNDIYKLTFGLPAGQKGDKGEKGETGAEGPKGEKGDPFTYEDFTESQLESLRGPSGSSIQSIDRTAGNGAQGTIDTYTVTLTNGDTSLFQVYNGKDGTGTGDFLASGEVSMTGTLQMSGNRISGLGTPESETDAVPKSFVLELLSGKANKPRATSVVLTAAGWSDGVQTVTIPWITGSETGQHISVAPAAGSEDAYESAVIRARANGAGSLKFVAKTAPAENITVYVTITEVAYEALPTITFYVDTGVYQAVEGMTWYEWCNSVYNTGGFTCSGETGNVQSEGYYISGSELVQGSDQITSGANYNVYLP